MAPAADEAIMDDFYVRGGLLSAMEENQAADVVKDLTALCKRVECPI